MNNLPHICIDPHLLSLPRMDTSSAEYLEDFVSNIVDWGKTVGSSSAKTFISNRVIEALDEDDVFPWRDRLVRVFKHYKVRSADPETVASVIQTLLNCARIEDSVGLKALLLEDKKTKIAPAFMWERLRPKTQFAFCDLLAMIVLLQHGYGRDVEQVVLASISNDNTDTELQYLSLSSEIVEFEWDNDSDFSDIDSPYAINDLISIFFSRNGLLEKIEPLSLWPATDDTAAARNAIDCCIARLIAAGTNAKNVVPYSIGSRFLQTAQEWECGQEGNHAFTLIESCARIALEIPKNEVKSFTDGTSRQKVRSDGALAYRTHLTKRGKALRLMLWKLPDGSIEFANVGDKDELTIL